LCGHKDYLPFGPHVRSLFTEQKGDRLVAERDLTKRIHGAVGSGSSNDGVSATIPCAGDRVRGRVAPAHHRRGRGSLPWSFGFPFYATMTRTDSTWVPMFGWRNGPNCEDRASNRELVEFSVQHPGNKMNRSSGLGTAWQRSAHAAGSSVLLSAMGNYRIGKTFYEQNAVQLPASMCRSSRLRCFPSLLNNRAASVK
jgi:hypothetical protein